MHESKCNNIHGHRYSVEVECTGVLDKLGRVIDFGKIKELCGGWIDEYLDHGMILWNKDPLTEHWVHGFDFDGQRKEEHHKHYIMDKNPTAENIAEHLYYTFSKMLTEYGIVVTSVVVRETPNCMAVYRMNEYTGPSGGC
jgi:6-pyruvoyltetrahydropterin/6-carboxytetrahydropterin synthase